MNMNCVLRIFAAVGVAAALMASTGCAGSDAGASPYPGHALWEESGPRAVSAADIDVTPELLASGKQIFTGRCAICHGENGDGTGPASRYLKTPPRNFTHGTFKFRTSDHRMPTDEDLFRSISAGFTVSGMPAFSYLPEADRWAVLHYVKGFYPDWDRWNRRG